MVSEGPQFQMEDVNVQYGICVLVRRLIYSTVGPYQPVKPIFTVPFGKDGHFVGREDIITEIEDRFKCKSRVSISGLGGVG
jgi:hypothetical protein